MGASMGRTIHRVQLRIILRKDSEKNQIFRILDRKIFNERILEESKYWALKLYRCYLFAKNLYYFIYILFTIFRLVYTYERIGSNSVELMSPLGIMHDVTNARGEFDKLWGTTNVITSIIYEINILLSYNIL